MEASTVLVALCVAAAALLIRRLIGFLRWTAAVRRLPSPPCTDFLAGHVKAMSDARHHRTLLHWDNQCAPVYSLRAFWMRMVVISDPHYIHQLLRSDRSLGVDKSMNTYQEVDPMSSDKGFPSLFTASTHSPHWRLVRKGVAPGFSTRCLRSGFRHIQGVCRELLDQLQRIGPGTAFDVDHLLMRATLDVIGRVAFDIDFRAVQEFNVAASNSQPTSNPEDDEIFTIIRESMNELNSRWANPLRGRYMFWLPEVRHAMRYWRALQQHMRGVLREIRSRGPPADGDESIAAHLMRLKDPHTGQPLADDRLLPEIATFFVAGTDTTAHTMTWTLYLVAQHPEVEARLCAELDALGLLATPQRPEPRMVEVEDLSRLVYLAAVVKESMRVLPVSADGTAIQAPRDIQLGPHTIPANTIIWVHIFSCHNSARYWDQPDRFLPERFMQPGAEYAASGPQGKTAGEAAAGQQAAAAAAGGQSAPPSQEKLPGDGSSAQGEAEVQHRPDSHGSSSLSPSFSSRAVGSGGGSSQPLRFFPFSQGPRNCVGQSLAKMDYLAILAVLLGRYTFQLTPEVTAPGGVRDIISLTLQPEHGLPVLAVPRVPQL